MNKGRKIIISLVCILIIGSVVPIFNSPNTDFNPNDDAAIAGSYYETFPWTSLTPFGYNGKTGFYLRLNNKYLGTTRYSFNTKIENFAPDRDLPGEASVTLSVSLNIKTALGCDVKYVKAEAGYSATVEYQDKKAIYPVVPPGQTLYVYQSYTTEYAPVYLSCSTWWRVLPIKKAWSRISFSDITLTPTKTVGGYMVSYVYS